MRKKLQAARKTAGLTQQTMADKLFDAIGRSKILCWLFDHTVVVLLDPNWDGPRSWQGNLILLLVQIGLVVWLTPIFVRWIEPLLAK